jgi:hypothetical protein
VGNIRLGRRAIHITSLLCAGPVGTSATNSERDKLKQAPIKYDNPELENVKYDVVPICGLSYLEEQ